MKPGLHLSRATILWCAALAGIDAAAATEARDLGIAGGGIVVVLGDTDRAIELGRRPGLLVYTQVADAAGLERVRREADAAGILGVRLFVGDGPLGRIHLADDIADALVAVGGAAAMPEGEALRVVRPRGKVCLGGKELVKPVPSGVDDWSHPYHGPDNNPLSRDRVARGPYLTQFLADPRYAPLPQVAVASAGRVFKAFGHIAFKEREEPWLDTLAAFNGYNGTLLWRRPIPPALMVHRNTLIATPDRLYFGDDRSCKILDAASGAMLGEIVVVDDGSGGTFWKWMGLEEGVLVALVGDAELRDPVIRARREAHGWPWNPLSPGFNAPENVWGFGRTLVAINPATGRVIWKRREPEWIDSRALCMRAGRIYALSVGSSLTCLEAKTGRPIWRRTKEDAPALFDAIGPFLKRQDWRTNWRTTAYLRCAEKALYFAGPQMGKLLAVSADDGRVLWERPYDNYQIILADDGVYGIGGQEDREPARRFDPLTGEVLAEYDVGRRACARVTGSIDALFCRAAEGSTRFDRATGRVDLLSPMRPNCHDGVTVANGLLYWWPSVCDCNLTLYGITCLAPAREFDFAGAGDGEGRLLRGEGDVARVASLPGSPADWPMFRANHAATATTSARIGPGPCRIRITAPAAAFTPSAPSAAGDLVYIGGSDGSVRAFDGRTGAPAWKAHTGGPVLYPPSIAEGRALVGSGDGHVYCLEALTGRLLWRFRVAPVERRIPVYGVLQSTWPVGGGVVVRDGVAYAAAGIANYDGTHLCALDVVTGGVRWWNHTSGHLDAAARCGVSVQGHLMIAGDRLYLAGGNAVSPAIYDLVDGRCLNDPAPLRQPARNNVPGSVSPRGSELYRIGDRVLVAGKPLYAHPDYPVVDPSVVNRTLLAPAGERVFAWIHAARLACFPREELASLEERFLAEWGKPRVRGLAPSWEIECPGSVAIAVGADAVAIATRDAVTAYDMGDGRALWKETLPDPPVPWGLALTREGGVIVALAGGGIGVSTGDRRRRQE